MLPDIITFTFAYQPEGGIVEHFLGSDGFREYYKNDLFPWFVTPINPEQVTELIDEYASDHQLGEDQRGALVAWLNGLVEDGRMFIAVVDRE
jgi:hypothetical protein